MLPWSHKIFLQKWCSRELHLIKAMMKLMTTTWTQLLPAWFVRLIQEMWYCGLVDVSPSAKAVGYPWGYVDSTHVYAAEGTFMDIASCMQFEHLFILNK